MSSSSHFSPLWPISSNAPQGFFLVNNCSLRDSLLPHFYAVYFSVINALLFLYKVSFNYNTF